MDHLARDLGIDRLAIRQRNYIQADEFPYEICSGAMYDSGDYQKTLARLAGDKYKSLAGEDPFVARAKTMSYLLQKGYEPELAARAIDTFH